jgi:hypothetical protein
VACVVAAAAALYTPLIPTYRSQEEERGGPVESEEDIHEIEGMNEALQEEALEEVTPCQILPLPISRYRFKFQSNLVWDSIKSISNFCFQF